MLMEFGKHGPQKCSLPNSVFASLHIILDVLSTVFLNVLVFLKQGTSGSNFPPRIFLNTVAVSGFKYSHESNMHQQYYMAFKTKQQQQIFGVDAVSVLDCADRCIRYFSKEAIGPPQFCFGFNSSGELSPVLALEFEKNIKNMSRMDDKDSKGTGYQALRGMTEGVGYVFSLWKKTPRSNIVTIFGYLVDCHVDAETGFPNLLQRLGTKPMALVTEKISIESLMAPDACLMIRVR